jgi:hypothetical protein
MPVETEITPSTYTPVRASRGTQISCKGWQQEAARRMTGSRDTWVVSQSEDELNSPDEQPGGIDDIHSGLDA